MKDILLGQGTKMFNLYSKPRQQNEVRWKQEGNIDNQTPHLPSSPQIGTPIKVPNSLKPSLKGSGVLQEIFERVHTEDKRRRETFAVIALEMTQAVIKEKNVKLQEAFSRQ
jgi:hypothetical protein